MPGGREGQVLLWRPLEVGRGSSAVTTETRGPGVSMVDEKLPLGTPRETRGGCFAEGRRKELQGQWALWFGAEVQVAPVQRPGGW